MRWNFQTVVSLITVYVLGIACGISVSTIYLQTVLF